MYFLCQVYLVEINLSKIVFENEIVSVIPWEYLVIMCLYRKNMRSTITLIYVFFGFNCLYGMIFARGAEFVNTITIYTTV